MPGKERHGKHLENNGSKKEDLQTQCSDPVWEGQFWSALIRSSPVGIYILQDGQFIFVSPAFVETSGYQENELIGMNSLSLVFADDREKVRNNAIEMLKGRRSSPYEFRIVTKNGDIRWIAETVTSVSYQGKQAVLGNFLDVTKRKLAEEELREAEQEVRLMFESVPDAITISTIEEGRYLYVNEGFSRLTGYSQEESLGKTVFELGLYVDSRDRERLVKALKEQGRVDGIELRYRMRDGRILYALLSGKLFRYKGQDCLFTVTKDITPIKEAEKKIQDSEQRYRELFDSVSDLIYTQDLEGRFLSANKTMTTLFGYKPEEFIGRKAPEFMKPELRPLFETEYLARLKKTGHYEGASSYFTKDGRKVYLEYRSNLIRPEKGEPYISGVARDITERILAQREIKKLERQILQAQKMEAVGTLAGGIAHDFNNLLQAILGYTQILLMGKDKDDPDVSNLRQIEMAAERARELTQQLLAFSRKVKSELRPVNLNQEVRQVEKLLRRTIPRMIDIEVHLGDELRVINADPAQLEQVMMNLCVNARDAMPEGGRLVIETENVVLDEGYCREHLGAKPGEYVLLTISDTGCGMDKETLEHIFEPFFTTKDKDRGTGLGLAMVYGIVKNHGGYIMCYSEPGEGTTFKIYFPVLGEGAEVHVLEEEEGEEVVLEGEGERILLVDDEGAIRELGKEILERFGYEVLLAGDGEEAVEIYRDRGGEISLVIMDYVMPGMGGRRCLEEILKVDPEAKVIIASGYSINGPTKEALKVGAKAFINKPYDLRQMLKVVKEVLK